MREVVETRQFQRDTRLMQRRGKELRKMIDVVALLANGLPLLPRHCPHPLKGNWKPKWDCHIEPDWLLIYEVTDTQVILARTGTHADLFG
jgi:mRNA interferase YafQ